MAIDLAVDLVRESAPVGFIDRDRVSHRTSRSPELAICIPHRSHYNSRPFFTERDGPGSRPPLVDDVLDASVPVLETVLVRPASVRALREGRRATELRRRDSTRSPRRAERRRCRLNGTKASTRDLTAAPRARTYLAAVRVLRSHTEDMKAAMRASEKELLSTIRRCRLYQQREVDERITLDDAPVLTVSIRWSSTQGIHCAVRARNRKSADKSGRSSCSRRICRRVAAAELDALIRDAIAATGAASIKDMGKVMGVVKSKAAGRADMAAVGARVRAALGG